MDLNSIIKSLGKKSDTFESRWPSQPQDSSGTDGRRNAFRKGLWGTDAVSADYLPPTPKKAAPPAKSKPLDWGSGLTEGQPDTSIDKTVYALRGLKPNFKPTEGNPMTALAPNTHGLEEAFEMLVPKKKLKGPNNHKGSDLESNSMTNLINQILGVNL